MNSDEIKAARELVNAANEKCNCPHGVDWNKCPREIAAKKLGENSRELVPKLLDEIERLQAKLAEAEAGAAGMRRALEDVRSY